MPERLIVLQSITIEILRNREHRHRSTGFIGHVSMSYVLSQTNSNICYSFVWRGNTSWRDFRNTDKKGEGIANACTGRHDIYFKKIERTFGGNSVKIFDCFFETGLRKTQTAERG